MNGLRSVCCVGLLLSALAGPGAAQTAKPAPPALKLQFATIDGFFDQFDYIARTAGFDEEAKQLIGFFKAARGAKGLDGVDTSRPIAVVAAAPQGLSVPVYLMIPVADEKLLVEDGFGKRLRLELKKEADDVRAFDVPNLPVKMYLKFARGYAYITALDPAFLADAKLPDPKSLSANPSTFMDLSVRLDQIPSQLKLFVLGQVETMLVAQKKSALPNESPALRQLREAAIDLASQSLKTFLMQTQEVSLRLTVDAKRDQLSAEWNLVPVAGSDLAKDLQELKSPRNEFGGLPTKNTFVRSTFWVSLPGSIRKPLNAVVDEGLKELTRNVPAEYAELAKGLVAAIEPTLKAGQWDGGIAILGPNEKGQLTALVGHKLYDGDKLDGVFRGVVKNLPEGLNNFIELDAVKVNGTAVHRMDVTELINVDLQRVLDPKTNVWLSFGKSRHLAYVGPDGKEQLQAMIETPAREAKLMELSFSAARIAPYYDLERAEAMRAVADTVFGKDPYVDRVEMSLQGGESLRWQLTVPGKVVRFLSVLRGNE